MSKILKFIFNQILLAFKENKLIGLILGVCLTIGITGNILNNANAGNLSPPVGPVGPTMNTLQELYALLAGEVDTSGATPDIDGNVNEQLKYILNLLGNLGFEYGDNSANHVLTTAEGAGTYDASNLIESVVAYGVEFGTASEGELYGSTNAEHVAKSAEYPGTLLYNQVNGGGSNKVDDMNNGGTPASGRYATGWTTCNSGNSWCGLGTNGQNAASKMDNVTGIVWSFPCSGTNCSNMSSETAATYNRATSINNCASGAHGKSGWSLPTQKQVMQAYVNGAYGTLTPTGQNHGYWTATLRSNNSSLGYRAALSHGLVESTAITATWQVRCVQLP